MSTILAATTLVHSSNGYAATDSPAQKYDGTNTYGPGAFTMYSVPHMADNKDTIGVQVTVAGASPNGTFSIQVSNDFSQLEQEKAPDANLVNWATCSFWDESAGSYVQSKAIAAAGSFMATIQVLSARWWRIVWVNNSGQVTPTIRVQVKADGGR